MSYNESSVLETQERASSGDARVVQLVQEIRDLYVHTCKLADEQGDLYEADDRELIEKCKPRTYAMVPELNYYKDVFDQQEALQRAYKDAEFKSMASRVQSVATFFVASICILVFLRTGSATVTTVLILASAVGAFWVSNRYWYRGKLQKILRRELAAQGVPICTACGYDLRGQTEPRCPECGEACEARLVGA